MPTTLRPAFPPEAQRQFDALLDEYAGLQAAGKLANPVVVRPRCDAIVAKLTAIAAADRWWTDLAQLELCINEFGSPESIRARVSGWRWRFREVAGDSRFAAYLAGAPVPASAPIEDVRADLGECMRGVYYLYAGYGVAATSRDSLIKELLKYAAFIIVFELLVALGLSLYRPSHTWWPIFTESTRTLLIFATWTSIVAVLGSVVSVQRRLEDPKIDADPYFRYIQTSADRLSVSFSSPFLGAVFGYIIFGLVASKIVLGSIVPSVEGANVVSTSFILILGFVSGFAEQLVPDALTRVAARALGSVADGGTTPAASAIDAGQPGGLNGAPPESSRNGGGAKSENTNGATNGRALKVAASEQTIKVGSKATITVDASGTTGPISASTTDASVVQLPPAIGSGPGPLSFDVIALQAGTATITVSAGSQTQTVQIQVVS